MSRQTVDISQYEVFSNTVDVWKVINEDDEEDDLDLEPDYFESDPPEFSTATIKDEPMDTSVKYEPKVDQAVDYTPLHSREQPEEREFTPNYSPIRAAQTDQTFPRNIRRRLNDSTHSSSAPPTTIRRSPITRASPPLGSETPDINMMATPTEIPSSLSSSSSDGVLNLIHHR
ncbi:hypothetical protein G6F42_026120 [Rhizopus arrhizus]|nr:hypothetical protein G6F42_026120 [Rhizopus arrhizus]